jgi:(E)-4-hydroxy-3-methylbut-2-enyl-diphosphate synthase
MNSNKKFTTNEVKIGKFLIGNNNPIKIQSMTNTDTLDVIKTSEQIMRLSDNGCDIVRVTTQGLKHAYACEKIKNILIKKNYNTAIVADIHFYYKVALAVADFVDKIRINPGNFLEKRATFKEIIQSEEENLQSLNYTEEKLIPLIEKLKKNKVALRIGVNHGSLSDRIMTKYGNTKEGMVKSAIEYAKIFVKHNFHQLVFSMKSSNVKVMIDAYRLLVDEMIKGNLNYPLHLGVTEAGEGEDGIIKSSIGIGSLLLDGIGDTIRVSLTNDPIEEIKPAKEIAEISNKYKNQENIRILNENKNIIIAIDKNQKVENKNIDLIVQEKDSSIIFADDLDFEKIKDHKYIIYGSLFPINNHVKLLNLFLKDKKLDSKILLNVKDFKYNLEEIALIGSLIIDNLIDGVLINSKDLNLILNILQAALKRNTKTDFISCPSCGRTLFDIQKITLKLKKEIPNIPNLKIAIMGCVVNGPGEMQDAEFGYVGAGKKLVDLYVDQKIVKKNVLETLAFDELLKLIKQRYKIEKCSE